MSPSENAKVLDAVVDILQKSPNPLKAKAIMSQLKQVRNIAIDKGNLNSILYGDAAKSKLKRDDNWEWSYNNTNSGQSQNQNVNTKENFKKEDEALPTCPKCGSSMRKRQARKGRFRGKYFYGCSNYPVCHGIVNIATEHQPKEVETAAKQEEVEKKKVEGTPITDRQKKQLQILRDRFLNITTSNQSIKLNKLYDKWAFDLSILNMFGKEQANEVIESALRREKEIQLAPIVL